MQSDFKERLKKLEKIFGIKIKDKELFKKALVHSSYTKENELSLSENYERLEFLGDAVLKLCISNILFKNFPKYPEGELTKIRSIIVSDNSLAEIALQIGLSELVILGKQEEKTGGRDKKSILACVFEAILGAYYLDGKYENISKFLEKTFMIMIKDVDEHFEKFNAKAVLQEYTQSKNKQIPNYKVIEELGPEHDKTFVIEVRYMGDVLATGKGKTKREAEQACAYEACKNLGVI
ncbi:MAG: ribonuclease III [Candidatus Gastranaerophilales bacterium]|nr:ribonuclease III [Candidatus Gastranaerophilales bacterium]